MTKKGVNSLQKTMNYRNTTMSTNQKTYNIVTMVIISLILGLLITIGIQMKHVSNTADSLEIRVNEIIDSFEATLDSVESIVGLIQDAGDEMFYHQFEDFREFKTSRTDELKFLAKKGRRIVDSTFDEKLVESIEKSLQDFKNWRKQ